VFAPELVVSEVTKCGISGVTVGVGPAGLVSAPELGTSEAVVSGSLLKTGGVVLGIAVLVSSPSVVANEAVVSET
jgi:hypothetical protein